MKLTKQKLEQLILQEMQYYRPPEFDPRAEKNYPEYASKLSDRYKDSPAQATSLGDSLDEPIDVEVPETDEEPEEFLPFGIHQFEQVSPVTIAPRNLGTLLDPGIVEIFFDTDDKKWVVAYYKETGPNRYQYVGKHSKEYPKGDSEKAIQHYNSLADEKFVRSKPLKKRGEGFKFQPYKK